MATTFKDVNLKFGIIACLNEMGLHLEEGAKIKRVKSYQRAYKEAYYSEPIQEVIDYYTALDIPQQELDSIVTFDPSVSADCYNNMIKEWDGEDERYDITDLDGIKQLRNMTTFHGDMLSPDEEVDISALLKCPKLEKVKLDIEFTEEAKKVMEQLRAHGVAINTGT